MLVGEAAKTVNHRISAAIDTGLDSSGARPIQLNLGVGQAMHRVEVAPIEGVDGLLNDLHVLTRHRSPSIAGPREQKPPTV